MKREDIRAFVERDWAAVAAAKATHWAVRKRSMSPAEALAIVESLHQYAHALQPGWPNEDERAADLALHVRISEALRAVLSTRPR